MQRRSKASLVLFAFAVIALIQTTAGLKQLLSGEPSFDIPSLNVEVPSPSDAVSLIRLEPLDTTIIYPPVVTALASANDGRWLVAAGDDHALRIVQVGRAEVENTLSGHTDWVQAVAIDETRQNFLSCAKDGTLLVWKQAEDWKSKTMHRSSVALMAMTIDKQDRYVAVAGFGSEVWIYSLEDHTLVQTLICPCSDSRALAFSNDGSKLACGGRDGIVRIWNWRTNEQPLEQALHHDRIRAVRFSPDNADVVTIGEDRRVIRYRYDIGQVVTDRRIATGRLLSMTFIDDQTLAVAGSDNTIRLIDIASGDEVNRLIGHEGSVAVMTAARNQLITGSFDTTIRLWDIARAVEVRTTSAGRYVHPVSARFQDSGISEGVK